jgi:hypothetical protein
VRRLSGQVPENRALAGLRFRAPAANHPGRAVSIPKVAHRAPVGTIPAQPESGGVIMRSQVRSLTLTTLLLALLAGGSLGCDDILHEASYFLEDAADALDDFADDWGDHRHDRCCNDFDDIWHDIEDWFD